MEEAEGGGEAGGRNEEVTKRAGAPCKRLRPALFAFMGSLSSSVGLSAWRWACAVPRCGSRCFRNGQRKAIIRTHRLSETGSDYIGLVPEVGLEPTRCRQQRILSYLLHREYKRTQPLMEVANGHQKRCKQYYF